MTPSAFLALRVNLTRRPGTISGANLLPKCSKNAWKIGLEIDTILCAFLKPFSEGK